MPRAYTMLHSQYHSKEGNVTETQNNCNIYSFLLFEQFYLFFFFSTFLLYLSIIRSSKGNIISVSISRLIVLHVGITSFFESNLLKVLPADLFSLCRHHSVSFKAYFVFLQESHLFLCISLILPCLDGFLQIFKVFSRTLLFLPNSCFGHQTNVQNVKQMCLKEFCISHPQTKMRKIWTSLRNSFNELL